ncbi:MAG: hypothetical protein ACPK85_01280 [Methanosarcina sp.]
MKGKFSTLLLVFGFLISLSTTASAAVDWKISESNLTVGNALKIKGTASPGETIKTEISFDKKLSVSKGKYRYLVENIEIPPMPNNLFTVTVEGVQSLNVGVKNGIWVTYSPKVSGGIATVTQANMPARTYSVLVSGDAIKEKADVNLKVKAYQTSKADSTGKFEYIINTSTMPPGKYKVKIGNSEKTIELKSKK